MKIRTGLFLVTTFSLSVSSPLGWCVTTTNQDGFSTDLSFPAASGIIASGFRNQSSPGNHGSGMAGGNMIAGTDNFVISSDSSFSVGIGNNLNNQEGSVSMGFWNEMNFPTGTFGQANFAFGYCNQVVSSLEISPWGCFLIGAENQSSAPDSWVIGKGNLGQLETVTLGTYAATVPSASLIVGTGTGGGSTPRTNGLVVLKNGTVSIPGGILQLGSENALTASSSEPVLSSYLSTNNYLKKNSGANSTASASAICAFGSSSSATGAGSLSFGNYSQASGDQSLSIGPGSKATAWASIAIQGSAEAYQSVAIGPYTRCLGAASTAIGYGSNTTEDGFAGTAIGFNAKNNGGYSTSIGYYSEANGWTSAAFGNGAISNGRASSSFGTSTLAHASCSIALGSANIGNQGNAWDWIESDPVFELGNSPDTTNRSNAITTLKNGQTTLINKAWKNRPVSISATADPSTETTDSDGEALVVDGHTRLRGKVVIEQPQGDISMGIYGE